MLHQSSQSNSSHLLLVEDEPRIREALRDSLVLAGYEVETADDGMQALKRASQGGLDAIILDLMLPKKDGVAVCQELREDGIDTPVLMLTARTELNDMLKGFAVGADDYLTKPFQTLELLARIRALLHRAASRGEREKAHVYFFGQVRIDPIKRQVWRANQRVQLSTKEYDLLLYFVTHPNETLARERLLRKVWMTNPKTHTRTVDVHVAWLRQKIGDEDSSDRWIRTVYGKGYEFVPD